MRLHPYDHLPSSVHAWRRRGRAEVDLRNEMKPPGGAHHSAFHRVHRTTPESLNQRGPEFIRQAIKVEMHINALLLCRINIPRMPLKCAGISRHFLWACLGGASRGAKDSVIHHCRHSVSVAPPNLERKFAICSFNICLRCIGRNSKRSVE